MRNWTFAAALALFALWAGAAHAIDPVWSNWRGLALRGYDTVAYHTDGKPLEGDSDHSFEWKDATWRFASAENLAAFKADPERYAPQYGSYCAYAVANNTTASVDPEAWKIVDGKLYLNYSRNIQERWEEDIPGNIAKGDVNWPRLLAD